MSATEKYNIRPGDDIDLVTTYGHESELAAVQGRPMVKREEPRTGRYQRDSGVLSMIYGTEFTCLDAPSKG